MVSARSNPIRDDRSRNSGIMAGSRCATSGFWLCRRERWIDVFAAAEAVPYVCADFAGNQSIYFDDREMFSSVWAVSPCFET